MFIERRKGIQIMENVINKEIADKMISMAALFYWQTYYKGRKLNDSAIADVNNYAREMFEGYCDYYNIEYEDLTEVKEL